ncbi:MAG: TrkH family potassium uptake protein [Paracoccaceae bacterium]
MARLTHLPLFLLLFAIAGAAMYAPAIYALRLEEHAQARAFFYAGTLGLTASGLIAISLSGRKRNAKGGVGNLVALLAAYIVLPVFLAVPFHEALGTTSFVNAYFEMVSSLTTTGATLFADPNRLPAALHLWRAEVGWLGGFLIWVAAAAVLAPLNLGGFEVTSFAEPGQGDMAEDRQTLTDPALRLLRSAAQLLPVYVGLTLVLWILLMITGDRAFVALCHAMSTMATSGISPVGGLSPGAVGDAGLPLSMGSGTTSGIAGEMVIFLFLLFALSRLTFSSDSTTGQRQSLRYDPEFRIGIMLVLGVPLLLFLRHFIASFDLDAGMGGMAALHALWGGVFTVLSFLSTTGFVSADWDTAQAWSGLPTTGLILLGLALVGGGVATTAGGVKLLRVYALYLNGLREMEKLVHPHSVGGKGAHSRRIRRKGAYVAWIFFMLFALSLSLVIVVLAGFGADFEQATVLAIAALSTTGPLIGIASDVPIILADLSSGAKLVLGAAMVLGRLETLAIVALVSPSVWRN